LASLEKSGTDQVVPGGWQSGNMIGGNMPHITNGRVRAGLSPHKNFLFHEKSDKEQPMTKEGKYEY